MRKSFALALLFALALPFTAQKAQAQGFSLIPYLGYNLDAEAFLVGIGTELEAPFSAGNLALAIRPSVEYLFTDDINTGLGNDVGQNVLQINGDVIARLSASGFEPYAGVGLAVVLVSTDFDCDGNSVCEDFEDDASGSDIGLNLVGGLEFPGAVGFGTPFAQARITLADGTAISLLGGVSIPLGAN